MNNLKLQELTHKISGVPLKFIDSLGPDFWNQLTKSAWFMT